MPLTADTDPRYGRFTLRTECPACGSHLPINGLHGSPVGCADCGEEVPIPDGVVGDMLDWFEREWPKAQHSSMSIIGDLTWRWAWTALDVAPCPACAAALPAPDDSGFVRCGQCAAAQPARRLPRDLGAAVHSARWVIGGEVGDDAEGPDALVALACPSCGAGLQITSHHHRITPCKACGNQIHVPDAVWRALHPPRKVLPWIVRFEGPSRAATAAKRELLEALKRAEKEKRKQEHQREKYAAEERKRALDREEKARLARVRAEEDAVRAKWSIPWLGLSWALSVSGVAVALTATALEVLAHVPGLPRLGVSAMMANLAADVAVFGAAAWLMVAWLAANVAVTRRIGAPLATVVLWPQIMVAMTLIPIGGSALALMFAKQCWDGTEPTTETEVRVPRSASLPAALILLVLAFYPYVVFAALTSTAAVARFGR